MKISDVMKLTGLTRKAILYYEENGLVNPTLNENNSYREYSQDNVERLLQISVLRQMDVTIKDIKEILYNPEKLKTVLELHLAGLENEINNIEKTKNVLKLCLSDFDNNCEGISSITNRLMQLNDCLQMDAKRRKDFMKKQMQRIFPGVMGKGCSILYGAFLNEPLDTAEKENAWISLVNYLDGFEGVNDIIFPEEVASYYDSLSEEDIEIMEENLYQKFVQMISYTDDEFERYKAQVLKTLTGNKQFVKDVEKYTQAELTIKSRIRPSGYYDSIDKYLKVLCPNYIKYTERAKSLEDYIATELGIDVGNEDNW